MNQEQLKEAHRLAKLIIGFNLHELTPGQQQQLDDWIAASDDNMKLFERLTTPENKEEALQWFRDIDAQTALHNRAIASEKKRITKRKRFTYIAVSIVLLIIATTIYQYYSANRQLARSVNEIIASFQDTLAQDITLITSSGKRVPIHDSVLRIEVTDNVQAQNKGGTLMYNRSDKSERNTLVIPQGHQYRVVLSDGSKVWLNAESSLVYATSFNDSSRTVRLQGEGYFEVAPNTAQPFIVECRNAKVKVTGTAFNIQSYPNEKADKITLIQGAVEYTTSKVSGKLAPGQQAIVSPQNAITSDSANAQAAGAWTKGLFDFDRSSLREVMQEIARWYGVHIIYEEPIERQFTGTIPRSSSLQQVLNMLEMSARIHFTVSGKTVSVRS